MRESNNLIMNLKLEDVLSEWETDSVLDENHLDQSTINIAKMHAKYLRYLSVCKLRIKKRKLDFDVLKRDKWLYYSGKMSREEMDARQWQYDPFNGHSKPMKSELDTWIMTDKEVAAAKASIEYIETMKEALEEILNTIRWRHSAVRNIIDWKRFTSGG